MAKQVFLAYAVENEALVAHIREALIKLQQQGLIAELHEHKISDANQKADEQLIRADMVLLMLSRDFMDSPYSYCEEMKQAVKRHQSGEAKVVPVQLSPVYWGQAAFAAIAAVPDTPLTTQQDQEAALREVVSVIKYELAELSKNKPLGAPGTVPTTSTQGSQDSGLLQSPIDPADLPEENSGVLHVLIPTLQGQKKSAPLSQNNFFRSHLWLIVVLTLVLGILGGLMLTPLAGLVASIHLPDLRDPSWQFWFGLLSITLAVLIPLVSWLLSRRLRNKCLSYDTISDIGLINSDKDLGEGIELSINGRQEKNLRVQEVKLENTGSEPLATEDYGGDPISFVFDPPSVIRCSIHSTKPETLIAPDRLTKAIKLESDNRGRQLVKLEGIPLNPGEAINLKIVKRDKTDMQVFGHIVGGEIKKEEHQSNGQAGRTISAGLVIAFLVGLMISNGFHLASALVQGNCALSLPGFPVNVGGSTAFAATVNIEAEKYHEACPIASFNVQPQGTSSGASLQTLENGNLQIADSELTPQQAGFPSKNLEEHPVAVIVFSLIVNKGVNVVSLSRVQISGIYNGTITNWREVGGPDLAIIPIGRPGDSGTHAAFVRYVLNGVEKPVQTESSTAQVIHTVETTPGAIGYVDLGSANRSAADVTALEIDQHAASAGLVESDVYPFWVVEKMYTQQNADALSLSFINYVMHDIRTDDTFISLTDMPRSVLATHE